MISIIRAFFLGFIEGKGDYGLTWHDRKLNEAYDWGRSLRRMSRTK